METGTLQSVKQFTSENKTRKLEVLFWDRSARVSTMMVLAFHNTWSPAGARLTAPGAEILTEMKLLEGAFIIQVSGCSVVPAASLQESPGSDGVLSYRRCSLLQSLSYQVKLPRLHNVGESEWEEVCKFLLKIVRGHLEATHEWMVAGNAWLPPTETKFFLFLYLWNWRTLATSEQEHQTIQQDYRKALISIYYILPQQEQNLRKKPHDCRAGILAGGRGGQALITTISAARVPWWCVSSPWVFWNPRGDSAQRIHEISCKGNLINLLLTGKEKLIGDINTNGNLGCSDHVVMGIQDPERINEGKNQHKDLWSQRRSWPVQGFTWQDFIKGYSEEQKETRKADWSTKISPLNARTAPLWHSRT